MQIRTLVATSAVALVASLGASRAQETMSDGLVMVNVAGSIVEVPVSIAAQACGVDAAEIIEASGMMNTDAKGADMVAAEPEADGASASEAEATAGDAADATTEAAVGTGAATTETDTGTVAEAPTDAAAADPGLSADTATGTDAPAGSDMADATAEAPAAADATMATAVCEIDQATADQHGFPAAGETSGG